MEPSKQCPYCCAANVSVAASCINCHAPLWIDALQQPLLPRGHRFSEFLLLAVKPDMGPAYHAIGYYELGQGIWRNNYGVIDDGSYGPTVTHWMPLPPIPGG